MYFGNHSMNMHGKLYNFSSLVSQFAMAKVYHFAGLRSGRDCLGISLLCSNPMIYYIN